MNHRPVLLIVQFIAILFIAGCAIKPRIIDQNDQKIPSWYGRLSMQVQGHPNESPPDKQSFNAAFGLRGTPQFGYLDFYSPLGSTAAAIHWTPEFASLETQGETRTFAGLNPLIQHLLGTDVPVSALFDWLNGRERAVNGWEVNLTQFAQGRISAQRISPLPQAQLRIILDN
nr:lipoprotein insertase outer membrane protein LolB [uncultured Rhodoferax sp.]